MAASCVHLRAHPPPPRTHTFGGDRHPARALPRAWRCMAMASLREVCPQPASNWRVARSARFAVRPTDQTMQPIRAGQGPWSAPPDRTSTRRLRCPAASVWFGSYTRCRAGFLRIHAQTRASCPCPPSEPRFFILASCQNEKVFPPEGGAASTPTAPPSLQMANARLPRPFLIPNERGSARRVVMAARRTQDAHRPASDSRPTRARLAR